MTPPPPARRYDLGWRRGNLAVLIVLATLAAAALGARALLHTRDLGPTPRGLTHRAAAARELINPNTATAASLRRLPRIGPILARAIIAARRPAATEPAAGGPFTDLDDLQHRVRGVGPKTAQRLGPHLTFDE